MVKVRCQTTQGDSEVVNCLAVGHNVRVVLGSILTTLGKPVPDNGLLEVRGDDKVQVTYVDQHTADRSFDRPLLKEIQVVGDGLVDITDGAYSESLRGVVLGRSVNLQVTDADHDTSDNADTLKATIEVYREKSAEETRNRAGRAGHQGRSDCRRRHARAEPGTSARAAQGGPAQAGRPGRIGAHRGQAGSVPDGRRQAAHARVGRSQRCRAGR